MANSEMSVARELLWITFQGAPLQQGTPNFFAIHEVLVVLIHRISGFMHFITIMKQVHVYEILKILSLSFN